MNPTSLSIRNVLLGKIHRSLHVVTFICYPVLMYFNASLSQAFPSSSAVEVQRLGDEVFPNHADRREHFHTAFKQDPGVGYRILSLSNAFYLPIFPRSALEFGNWSAALREGLRGVTETTFNMWISARTTLFAKIERGGKFDNLDIGDECWICVFLSLF